MIIGILGKKYSGKDTIADYFVENFNFQKYTLASTLKSICKLLFNFTDEQLNTSQKEIVDDVWNISPRKCMEFLGTDIFRNEINELIPNIGDNFWIKVLTSKINNDNKHNNIVISDVRFQNEIDYIHKLGGIIIKVQKHDNPNYEYSSIENNIDTLIGDYVVDNNHSIDDLYNKINTLYSNIILNNV